MRRFQLTRRDWVRVVSIAVGIALIFLAAVVLVLHHHADGDVIAGAVGSGLLAGVMGAISAHRERRSNAHDDRYLR